MFKCMLNDSAFRNAILCVWCLVFAQKNQRKTKQKMAIQCLFHIKCIYGVQECSINLNVTYVCNISMAKQLLKFSSLCLCPSLFPHCIPFGPTAPSSISAIRSIHLTIHLLRLALFGVFFFLFSISHHRHRNGCGCCCCVCFFRQKVLAAQPHANCKSLYYHYITKACAWSLLVSIQC